MGRYGGGHSKLWTKRPGARVGAGSWRQIPVDGPGRKLEGRFLQMDQAGGRGNDSGRWASAGGFSCKALINGPSVKAQRSILYNLSMLVNAILLYFETEKNFIRGFLAAALRI